MADVCRRGGRGKYEGCVARKPDSKGVLTDLTSSLEEVGPGRE